MFRLISAEFKKLFFRPSLFIVTALLIFVLGFSSTIYKPYERDRRYVDIPGETVSAVWGEFNNGDGVDSKTHYDDYISDAQKAINFYKTPTNTVKDSLDAQLTRTINDLNTYYSYASVNNSSTASAKEKFKTDISNMLDYYEKNVKKSELKYVVAPANVHYTITRILGDVLEELDRHYNEDENKKITQSIYDQKYLERLETNFGYLIGYYPDHDVVVSLQTYVDETKYRENNAASRLYQIYTKAKNFYNTHSSPNSVNADSKNVKELLSYITDYYQLCTEVFTIVRNSIDVSALSKFNETQINNFYGLEKANLYQLREELVKNKYLYETETFENNYANVFSTTQTSNYDEINAYDYSFYALRLCSFVIIIFICVLGASTIASEQANGTLKLLAIRPYRRSKILTAKILSIIMMGLLLLFISSVVTLIIGGINYSFDSLPVLLVFNATQAVEINAILEYLIYFASLFIQVIVYTYLSVAISTIFKSSIGSVAVSIMLFFATMILNTISVPILILVPLCHLDLFIYMGASFLGPSHFNIIDTIFAPHVTVGFSFYISLFVLLATIIIFAIITYVIFNVRDIK